MFVGFDLFHGCVFFLSRILFWKLFIYLHRNNWMERFIFSIFSLNGLFIYLLLLFFQFMQPYLMSVVFDLLHDCVLFLSRILFWKLIIYLYRNIWMERFIFSIFSLNGLFIYLFGFFFFLIQDRNSTLV